jgi:hypothetical protein
VCVNSDELDFCMRCSVIPAWFFDKTTKERGFGGGVAARKKRCGWEKETSCVSKGENEQTKNILPAYFFFSSLRWFFFYLHIIPLYFVSVFSFSKKL